MIDNIYVLIFILVVTSFLLQLKREFKCISIILLLFMCVTCALRPPTAGADTYTYLQIYGNPNALENNKSEFIFYWIVKLIYNAELPIWISQIVMATFIYSTFGYVILKISQKPSLSLLIFVISINTYFTESFNITRQCIATGFLLICWDQLNRGNIKKALILFIVATGFHLSSLVYFPFAFLAYQWKFSKTFLLFSLLSGLVFAFIFSSVGLITETISKLGNFEFEKYASYATYQLEQSRTKFGLISDLIPISVLSFYAFCNLKKQFLIRLLCLGVLFLDIVSIMPTAYRMSYGLISIEILIYPLCFLKKSREKWILYMLIMYLIALWSYNIPNMETAKLLPYDFNPAVLLSL